MEQLQAFKSLLAADYRAHYGYKGEARLGAALLLLPRAMVNPCLHAVCLVRLMTLSPRWLAPLWRNVLLIKHTCDVGREADIGPGLDLPHPWGVVLGHAKIGRNCVLYHNVTIGAQARHQIRPGLHQRAYPIVGDDVVIYCGAVLVGPITIGDRAIIGANTLVDRDVPADTLVAQADLVEYRLATHSHRVT